jgi:hypothetical protein
VIVGVDAGELWHQNSIFQSFADRIGQGYANHAVIVSGIDTSDPEHPQVTVTDPGRGDEAQKYSWHEFMDAWRTSHFTMVSTTEPAPSTLPEMVNFDYHEGHIPMADHASYEFTHELSEATAHDTDPGVVQRLESVFVSVLEGHVSMEQLSSALGLHEGSEGFMHDLVSGLVHFAEETSAVGAAMAFLEEPSANNEASPDSSLLSTHEHDSNAEIFHSDDAPFHDSFSANHDTLGHDGLHHHMDQQFEHHDSSQDGSAVDTDPVDDGSLPPDTGHHN